MEIGSILMIPIVVLPLQIPIIEQRLYVIEAII